jgi:ketosteroid isomerase-like protein
VSRLITAPGFPAPLLGAEINEFAERLIRYQLAQRSCSPGRYPGLMTTPTDDIEEIRKLLAEYCFAIDSRDAERWAHLFTEGGIFSSNTLEPLAGRAALQDFVETVVPADRRHMTTNEIISVEGNTATVRAYAMVTRDSPPVLSSVGTYQDTLMRTVDGWKFSQRHFHRD